jgi:RNA polymerase sigma-54 factor
MTPQLRQAIKLLQFNNLEAAAFVEEELERNPLLERDESTDAPAPERESPDLLPAIAEGADIDAHIGAASLPAEGAGPLDTSAAAQFDTGGSADGFSGRSGGRADFDDSLPSLEETLASTVTLRDHLGEQLRLSFAGHADRLIGAHLIALLDGAGRLTAAPEAIAATLGVPLAKIEAVRARMMQFDPVGLFARDLKECLAAQLIDRNRFDPAMQALLDNLPLLASRDYRRLLALCGVGHEDLGEMIAEIRALDPKPAARWDHGSVQAIIPDVLLRFAPDGSWLLELNPATMPRVLVNQSFYARVMPDANRTDRAFLSERLQSANWLVKSLQQRAQTILKVATEIVISQDAFFRLGVAHLRPLILRDIAVAIEMHESTVSRVTANKYIETPRGTFELKYFFTTAIAGTSGESHSAEAVRHRIRSLIESEPPDKIFSDDAIVIALRAEGVDIARRTVAKYREALGIPSSVQRKRDKTVLA